MPTIHDREFEQMLSPQVVREQVGEIAAAIEADFAGQRPILLAILNGSFVFAADLMRAIGLDSEVAFIKLKSYDGMNSSGQVTEMIGLDRDLKGRHVIIVEDIIDSGNTMADLLPRLRALEPASLKLAVLLVKPDALQHDIHIDYRGFDIPNDFVVGYGLDYDEAGRGLEGIYRESNK